MGDKKKVLELIERAAREGWTALDLRGNDLAGVPAEITKLTSLDLSMNALTSVRPEIAMLANVSATGRRAGAVRRDTARLDRPHARQVVAAEVQAGQVDQLGDLKRHLPQFIDAEVEAGQVGYSLAISGGRLVSWFELRSRLVRLVSLAISGGTVVR